MANWLRTLPDRLTMRPFVIKLFKTFRDANCPQVSCRAATVSRRLKHEIGENQKVNRGQSKCQSNVHCIPMLILVPDNADQNPENHPQAIQAMSIALQGPGFTF